MLPVAISLIVRLLLVFMEQRLEYLLVGFGCLDAIELVIPCVGAEYFFEARLPNCIEGAVNISNRGLESAFFNIVILFD